MVVLLPTKLFFETKRKVKKNATGKLEHHVQFTVCNYKKKNKNKTIHIYKEYVHIRNTYIEGVHIHMHIFIIYLFYFCKSFISPCFVFSDSVSHWTWGHNSLRLQVSPKHCPGCIGISIRGTHHSLQLLTWVLGIPIQAFMFVWQVPDWLGHPLNPHIFIFILSSTVYIYFNESGIFD